MTIRPAIAPLSLIVLIALDDDVLSSTKTTGTLAEFTAGDYSVHVEATRNVKKRRSFDGNMSLRPLSSDFEDGLGHPYYGWTDIDFGNLGAAMDATATLPSSRDPENPGVLAVAFPADMGGLKKYLRVPASGGTVMLLVGTVSNRKETRMSRDGGGIALLAQARKNGCIVGEWVSNGVFHGAEGVFQLCPKNAGK